MAGTADADSGTNVLAGGRGFVAAAAAGFALCFSCLRVPVAPLPALRPCLASETAAHLTARTREARGAAGDLLFADAGAWALGLAVSIWRCLRAEHV